MAIIYTDAFYKTGDQPIRSTDLLPDQLIELQSSASNGWAAVLSSPRAAQNIVLYGQVPPTITPVRPQQRLHLFPRSLGSHYCTSPFPTASNATIRQTLWEWSSQTCHHQRHGQTPAHQQSHRLTLGMAQPTPSQHPTWLAAPWTTTPCHPEENFSDLGRHLRSTRDWVWPCHRHRNMSQTPSLTISGTYGWETSPHKNRRIPTGWTSDGLSIQRSWSKMNRIKSP